MLILHIYPRPLRRAARIRRAYKPPKAPLIRKTYHHPVQKAERTLPAYSSKPRDLKIRGPPEADTLTSDNTIPYGIILLPTSTRTCLPCISHRAPCIPV